jgi:hypothetical protein
MTGRYLIYTPAHSEPDERRFDRAWRRFAEVCRSLHRDGLNYNVRFNLTDTTPHVLITASGKAKLRKTGGAHRVPLPPPVPAHRSHQCQLEVEWFLPENLQRRNSSTLYWTRHQARYQELSAMAEEHLRAEWEYWRELELLSGQRQHFKPGLNDDTRTSDDEVAA